MPPDSDGYNCFRELIQELRREHFDEVVGELGAAIRDFERTQPVVSPSLRSALEQCAQIVVRVWPDFPN